MRIVRSVSLAWCFLLVTLPTVVGQTKPDEQPSEVSGLKLPFPDVKGWDRSKPRALPGDGYSVAYNSDEKIAVTVYVYNRGLERIPDDLDGKEVKRELTGAKEAILEAKRRGIYDEVQEEKSGEATLGSLKDAPKMLYARYLLKIDKQENLSEIYVFPYRNHFVKLRITRSAKGPETAQASLDRLCAELSKMLAK
jgi:hypothetical protein